MITNYGTPKYVPGLHIFVAPKSLTTSDECHYAPNLKGHIALGMSVRPSVHYKFKIGFEIS